VYVGQPAVGAVVADREPFVVDAEQVKHGRVQVVDAGRVGAVGGFEAEVVAGAVADPAFDAAAGQLGREAARVVVPALAALRRG
jgi:hypothetical protein